MESYCALKSFLVSCLRINVCAHRSEVFLQLLGFHVFSIILVFFRWDIIYILRWNLNDKHPPCWPGAEGTKWITALWFKSVVWHAAEYGEDTNNSREEEGGTTAVTCVRRQRWWFRFTLFSDFGCVPPHSGLNPALSDEFMSQRMGTCWLSQMWDNYTKRDTRWNREMKVTHWHSEPMIDYTTTLFASTRLQEEN